MNRVVWAGLAAWTLATFLSRGVLVDLLAPFGVRPDLLSAIVVYWGLALGPIPGTLSGFLVGLVADAELGRGLGPQAALYAVAGFLVGRAARGLVKENLVPQAVLLFLTSLAAGALAAVLSSGAGSLVSTAALRLLVRSAYTAALGPIAYWLLRRLGVPDPLASGADGE